MPLQLTGDILHTSEIAVFGPRGPSSEQRHLALCKQLSFSATGQTQMHHMGRDDGERPQEMGKANGEVEKHSLPLDSEVPLQQAALQCPAQSWS